MSKRILAIGVTAALALLWGATAGATVTPEHKCQSGKNKAAGKYAACRQSAEAKFVTSSDPVKYGDAITKCETKLNDAWLKLEAAALAKQTSCPDGASTEVPFKAVIDEHSSNITTALGGGPLVLCGNNVKNVTESCDGSDLGGKSCTSFGFASGTLACNASCGFDTSSCNPVVCGNGLIDPGEDCDQNNLNGKTCVTQGFPFGTLTCGAGCVFDTNGCYSSGPRFVVNDTDGTITDLQTGLMWEKKAGLNGTPVDCGVTGTCADPHDADNMYSWTDKDAPTVNPTGTAYTDFLAQLNAGVGFASHKDWRLPTLEELQGIVDYTDTSSPMVNAAFDTGCGPSCTVTTCSCTAPGRYWSSSTVAMTTADAWMVIFNTGEVSFDTKDTRYYVRAVRP